MIVKASHYPEQIDSMSFFQDNSLDQTDIINSYNCLTAQEKYNQANELIHQQKTIHGCFSHCLNAIENRIEALQAYLLTKKPKERFIYSDVEPTQIKENIIWIQ